MKLRPLPFALSCKRSFPLKHGVEMPLQADLSVCIIAPKYEQN